MERRDTVTAFYLTHSLGPGSAVGKKGERKKQQQQLEQEDSVPSYFKARKNSFLSKISP